jgi:hypothetical protein
MEASHGFNMRNRILCGAPERTVRYLEKVLFVRAERVFQFKIQSSCSHICVTDRMGEIGPSGFHDNLIKNYCRDLKIG